MPPKKGYKQTELAKLNKSIALKKAYAEGRHEGGFKRGNTALRMTGKKHTVATKAVMSEKRKNNNPMHREEVRKKVSETRKRLGCAKGEKNYNWKGGVTPERNKIRGSAEYASWRTQVFKRDNYTCRECGRDKTYLNAHHVKPFAEFPELIFDVNNGLTLCKKCHGAVEKIKMKGNINGIRLHSV